MWKVLFSTHSPKPKATTTGTVDNEEVQHFEKFVAEWWNIKGPMKGLHDMNELRISLIKDGLITTEKIDKEQGDSPSPLKGVKILDVGCGGGILAESIAKNGGIMTGIDANHSLIEKAKHHAELNNVKVNYVPSPVEEHALTHPETYDVVVASEVLEHVSKKEIFLMDCVKCLKPEGSILITTINRTLLANLWAIHMHEYVLGWAPIGTHQYEKLVKPEEVLRILESNNCQTKLIRGWFYTGYRWHWIPFTSAFYVLHAVKSK